MSFYYLSTPYSKYPYGRVEAFKAAAKQSAILIEAGIDVFCPITHSHPISEYINPNLDTHDTWLRLDRNQMRASAGMILCKLPGWEQSIGIAEEIDEFKRLGKPIIEMQPGFAPPGITTQTEADRK